MLLKSLIRTVHEEPNDLQEYSVVPVDTRTKYANKISIGRSPNTKTIVVDDPEFYEPAKEGEKAIPDIGYLLLRISRTNLNARNLSLLISDTAIFHKGSLKAIIYNSSVVFFVERTTENTLLCFLPLDN